MEISLCVWFLNARIAVKDGSVCWREHTEYHMIASMWTEIRTTDFSDNDCVY